MSHYYPYIVTFNARAKDVISTLLLLLFPDPLLLTKVHPYDTVNRSIFVLILSTLLEAIFRRCRNRIDKQPLNIMSADSSSPNQM